VRPSGPNASHSFLEKLLLGSVAYVDTVDIIMLSLASVIILSSASSAQHLIYLCCQSILHCSGLVPVRCGLLVYRLNGRNAALTGFGLSVLQLGWSMDSGNLL
jgi:hypothetical protein